MKKIRLSIAFALSLFAAALGQVFCQDKTVPAMEPVSHSIWDSLLKKHIDGKGFANYKGFIRDSVELNRYLDLLSTHHPQDSWSREEQMAYWINAYNAFTVKLIVDHYPVKSIKDIKKGIPFVNTVWDIKFIKIQNKTYDLNHIEHAILRKVFKDARIHAAINCASYSCPRLLPEAFTASRLDSQLEDAMRDFINDTVRNRVSAQKAEISSIFNWFGGDFKDDAGSIRSYINRYAKDKVSKTGQITYMEYNWSLNDSKEKP